jgi:phosphate-selective porin
VQRARIKVGGFAYRPYIKYYLEYDFPSSYLLNWEFTFAKFKAVQFKLGQWKIKYNTERFISSGKQQFADRSISNRYFTYDRQIGVEILGTIFDNTPFSSSYNLGIFNGDGRMAEDEDGHLMLFGRYQWNFTGKEPKMSFCDIKQTDRAAGFLSVSYVHNQSAYTRFSSDGGGSITGFELGIGDQYIINQLGFELFFKYKGFSLMSENHIKKIDDTVNKEKSELTGGYAMAGYFPNAAFNFFPKNLEIIFRYALVNNSKFVQNSIEEYSFGLNWFFKSHLNKLTFDVSFLNNENFNAKEDNLRIRLQWDVSF